jgi:hypothetical protein
MPPREEKPEDEDEEERNDPSLRSLMMGMMNEMREMRLENALLHSTTAELCAKQAHTESKLAALEKECQDIKREAVTQHPATAVASAPNELGINNNKRYRHHNEVEELIRHLPYLADYDLSALAIKDLTYALSCMCAHAPPDLQLSTSGARWTGYHGWCFTSQRPKQSTRL